MKNCEALISFDPFCPLIGITDKSGFRLTSEKVNFLPALNFLSDKFGEGFEDFGTYRNDRWILYNGYRFFHRLERKKPWGIRLIVFEKDVLDEFFSHFIVNVTLDTSNTIEHVVFESIKCLYFSKLNSKRIRKMKHLIAEALEHHKLQWYDINFDIHNSLISFKINDTNFAFKL